MEVLKRVILGMVAISLYSGAVAKDYSIRYTQTVQSSTATYSTLEGRNNLFKMVSQKTVSDYEVIGEGPFEQFTGANKGAINEKVIGVDYPGYAHIWLEGRPESDICYVVYDSLAGTNGMSVPVSFKAEAQFIQGDWRSFLKGGFVRVRLTPAGVNVTMTNLRQFLLQSLETFKASVLTLYSMSGVSVGTPEIESIQFSGDNVYSGNLNSLVSQGASFTLRGQLTVNVPDGSY